MNKRLAEEIVKELDQLVRGDDFVEEDMERIIMPKLKRIMEEALKSAGETGS